MTDKPRILVFQHLACETPGIFRQFLAEDGIEWDAVELDEGEPVPDMAAYDALWVMGGPMDTWQEDENPWLVPEKQSIRDAVLDRKMPFLGFCLGHQLLADALGGEVGPSAEPEVGIFQIEMTEAGRTSPFMRGLPRHADCLQWHSAEVLKEPDGAEVLASSAACRVQAMSYGGYAFTMQYHVEITASTVSDWAEIPEYRSALENTLGAGALEDLNRGADANMSAFNRDSRLIYDNFMAANGLKQA